MITASSAARSGAIAKAVIASAPIAAAQSERRLNWLRDMAGSFWEFLLDEADLMAV